MLWRTILLKIEKVKRNLARIKYSWHPTIVRTKSMVVIWKAVWRSRMRVITHIWHPHKAPSRVITLKNTGVKINPMQGQFRTETRRGYSRDMEKYKILSYKAAVGPIKTLILTFSMPRDRTNPCQSDNLKCLRMLDSQTWTTNMVTILRQVLEANTIRSITSTSKTKILRVQKTLPRPKNCQAISI